MIQVDRHRVGTNPFLRHGLSEGLLPGPGDEVAAWTASQILRTYDHVATRSEKPRATFFAEKNAGLFLPNMFRTSFAGLREVFLMRDIRDVLCSIVAFDRKRGFPMGCSYDSLDDLGRKILRTFWIQYHTYCERVPEEERFFHRYEDFMQRPEEALRKLFDFLGVDSSPDTIRRVHRAATDDQGLVDIHTTSSSATASIGRWKTELKDPECLESIERFCRTCDYPLQASSAEAVSSR